MLKTVYVIIPENRALMIRVEGDITVEKVKEILRIKYPLGFVNSVMSVKNKALSEESFGRYS